MRRCCTAFAAWIAFGVLPVFAQGTKAGEPEKGKDRAGDARRGDAWSRTIEARAKRGTLHDAFQNVRGDSGKWNDDPILQLAPPLDRKPKGLSLDNWADQLNKQEIRHTSGEETWLLLRTRQLDDNDRAWVERIERRGNRLTVVVNEAIWQGRYSKTFTYYGVFGVNLGKLERGEYEVRWIIQPMQFTQFEGDGRPTDNWPRDDRPTDKKPTELHLKLRVVEATASVEQKGGWVAHTDGWLGRASRVRSTSPVIATRSAHNH